MSDETHIRAALKEWIAESNGETRIEDLADDTPLFRTGILKSVQVTDLILYIEELAGRAVDVEELKPGVFTDIDTIYRNFFGESHA